MQLVDRDTCEAHLENGCRADTGCIQGWDVILQITRFEIQERHSCHRRPMLSWVCRQGSRVCWKMTHPL